VFEDVRVVPRMKGMAVAEHEGHSIGLPETGKVRSDEI
jgi:hypothetical protein